MFSTKEESAVDDLLEIVHELIGTVQADAEVGDERWNEAMVLSERVETIESFFRQPKCEKCDDRDNGVHFNGDFDRYLCVKCVGDALAEEDQS